MMRPTRRDAAHADVRAEMRLDARARARGPHRSGATGTPAPRFSRNLRFALAALLALAGRCTAAGLDCASTSAALATLGACASGADEACCAALGGWNDAGCFCPGVESAVSQSDTYAAQAAALAAACGVAKADLATHATCAALSAGEGEAGAAAAETPRLLPEPATWAYVVLDASNPAAPRFRLVWSAKTAGGVDRSPTASFEVTHCAPGVPPSEAACAQSMTTQTVEVPNDASTDAREYSLDVPQTPSAPVAAFVSLTAVAGDGARSAPLGPFREVANYGASADGARDNAARVFIAPDASGAVSADASACGAHWAPCADLTVALAAAAASGATFTEAAPAEIVFLPGEHASAGNCGVELGAAMPVRVSGLVGSRSRPGDARDTSRSSPNGTLREPDVPAPFASIECGSAPNAGGLVAKPPHAVRIRALEIKNATRATGGGLFASGAGVNVEVTDTVFRACSAGGAGGGVAALDGAAVALADSAALDCAGGADGTGNEVRGGGVYVAGADTVASLRDFSAIGCSLPEENGKGGGVNVDGGASLTVDGLLVADCVSFFAGGVFVGTGCAPAIADAVVRDNAATYGAGIGAFAHSAATLRESAVFGNVAAEWGGGVLAYTHATLTLTDNTVLYENEAQLGGGAHAYVDSTLVVADGARIERNAASVSGGGAFLNAGADARFEGENTAVENNVARDIDGGGGIAVLAGASAVFRNGAALRANRAERGGGGGATCAGANASLAFRGDVVVSENVAATRGGGVLASRGCVVQIEGSAESGSEADPSSSRSVVFSGNAVQVDEERCRPGVFGGGAVALEPNIDAEADAAETLSETLSTGGAAAPTALRAARCAFRNNSAPDGGAVFVAPSDEMNASGDPREVARAAVVDVRDADVERNKAYGCVGGAAGARCGDAGAARVTAASSAALYANVTSPDASVAGGEGGGVFAAAGSIALRAGCLFAENEAADSGGGVRVAVAASLFAFGAGSRFERNVARAGTGGGVSHEGLALALLGPDVVFEENRALDGGAVAVVIEPTTAALVASRVSFFFEAFLADVPEERRVPDVAFAVAGADMRGNAAGRRGGSVYVSAPLAKGALQRLTVRDAQAVAGEAVYWTRAASPDAALACEACDLGGASAGAEPAAAAAAGGGALASLSGEMIGVATEALEVSFAGGVALPAELASASSAPAFAASLVDFYGRVAATENGVACRIEPAAVPAAGDFSAGTAAAEDAAVADALELGGALEASSEGGLVVFDGVVPRGRLGSTYEARIACADRAPASSAASDVVSQNAARNASDAEDVVAIAPVTFPVRIATCARGREPVVVGADGLTGAPVAKDCVECKDRTFNFDGVACVACPPGGDCRGGDDLLAKPGWWRSAEEAQRVFACPTKSACLPGNATGDAACAEGYEGPVCAVCSSGFRQWGRACVPCDDEATYALPIFGIVAFSAFLWYIFREPPGVGGPPGDAPAAGLASEDARGVKEPPGRKELPVKEPPVASDGAEDRAMALFSSLVFIAQCLGLLKEYDVAFPDGVDRVLDALDLTNLNLSALAPGCTDDSVNFYRSFVVGVSVPPAIVCACALVYHRAEAARRRHYAAFPRRTRTEHDAYESLKRRCARNAAWLLTLAYSGTAKTVFQLYNARRLDTGSFLRRDYSINVDGSGARVYSLFSGVGAAALLAYPVGIPLAIAALLFRGARGNKLDDETFKQKYGFLYAAYKPSFVAWELTGLTTKCFLAAVPVFATESTLRGGSNDSFDGSFDVGAGGGFALACQSTLAQAACLSLLVAILWLRPHRKAIHSAQQSAAVAVVLGWVLVLGNVLNVDAGDGAGVAFDDDEKFRVCFAAVAATLAAVVAMVAASFLAGELNAPARTATAAVKTARRSFKRLASRARLGGEGGKTRELAFGLDAAETGASLKTKTKTKKKAEALLDDDAPPGARRASFYERVDGDLHSSTVEVRIAPEADRA